MEGSGSVCPTNGSGSGMLKNLDPEPEHCFYGFNGTRFLWQFAYVFPLIGGIFDRFRIQIIWLLIPVHRASTIRIWSRGRKKITCPDPGGKKVLGTVRVPLFFKCNLVLQYVCRHVTIIKLSQTGLFHKEMVMFCLIWKEFLNRRFNKFQCVFAA